MEIPSIEQARGPDERPLDVGCVEGILARELRRLIPLRGGSHWVGASTLGREAWRQGQAAKGRARLLTTFQRMSPPALAMTASASAAPSPCTDRAERQRALCGGTRS